MFQGSALRSVELPSTLRRIECSAFEDCLQLKDVRLPGGLEQIGVRCFAHSGLEELVLPESVKEVGARAFHKCESLRRAQLNEGLRRLGAKQIVGDREYEGHVFAESALESVKLPSTLDRVGAGMFR